jgi:hypothetical protein
MPTHDRDILEAALLGYEHQQKVIDRKIEDIKSKLGSPAKAMPESEKPTKGTRKRRKLSKEARQKMAEAQKRRWAAVKKQVGK